MHRKALFSLVLVAGTACGAESPRGDVGSPRPEAVQQRAGTATPDSSLQNGTTKVSSDDGSGLTIDVQPTAVEVRGDTVRVSLSVRNLATSSRLLWIFTVEAPVPVLTVEQLGAPDQWDVEMTKEYGISVATWAFLGYRVTPGASAPPLAFSAIGLPGVVRYWAEPWVAPDTVDSGDPPADSSRSPVVPGPWNTAADSGTTVGIVPFPADRSRGALLARIQTLLQQSCARHWVDDAEVCDSLKVKLEHDDTGALLNELEAQRGKHVNELAYFLLAGNAHALPAQQQAPSK